MFLQDVKQTLLITTDDNFYHDIEKICLNQLHDAKRYDLRMNKGYLKIKHILYQKAYANCYDLILNETYQKLEKHHR